MSEPATKIPLWARILIGATATVLLAAVVGSVVFGLNARNFLKQASSTTYIESVVKSIAVIPTLPPRFKWLMAMETTILNEQTKLAVVQHVPTNTRMMLSQLASENRQKFPDADKMVSTLAATGFQNTRMALVERGDLPVAGEKMRYGVGEVSNSEVPMKGLIGVIYPAKSDKVIVLFGGTPGGTYNLEATKEFLAAIKSF